MHLTTLGGKLGAPSQLHRSLNRRNPLTSRRDGFIEGGLKSLICFHQLRMLIARRGDSRAGCQLTPLRGAQDARRGHRLSVARQWALST